MIKYLLPRTLLGRSLLILVTPLVVVQLVSAYIFYERHWDVVTRHLALTLAGDLVTVIEYLDRHPGPENRAWIIDQARYLRLDMTLREGEILANVPDKQPVGFVERAVYNTLDGMVQRPYRIDLWSLEDDVEIEIQLPDGVLHVMVPRKRVYSSTTLIFILWMVGTSMLLFGIATLFMRNQVRSVHRLATAVDNYGKGRDVPEFKPQGALEVRQAAAAFNRMRERIDRQITQRTEMLAGVSHDLRTPLTRMKLQLAMQEGEPGVAELRQDVQDMERMIEEYLAFARGEGTERTRETDLSALLEEVVSRFRREGAAVDLHLEESLSLPLRPQAFGRAVTNLVANAVRFAGHVSVRAGRRAGGVEVTVDDDGPGIPADKRRAVFKAFQRLDQSRNPTTGGVGLGLTIARDVVRGHGGDIRLEDAPLGGLRVRLSLPC